MGHSRVSTTMEICAQIVLAGQRLAVEQLSEFANGFIERARQYSSPGILPGARVR